jgi:UDP-2,4-diacetamido-2,4,6-trideoxy-beta-L-altropyranose hydrolase
MKVAFRVDASPIIGIGHLTRCLALARALQGLGAQAVFVTRDLGLDSGALIRAQGFDTVRLTPPTPAQREAATSDDVRHAAWAGVPRQVDADETRAALDTFGPDWLVVDHYALDRRWHERLMDGTARRICVIDDLADRPLRADLLVDHNPDPDHRSKYCGCAADVPRLLGGPRFALLGPAYATAARYEFSTRVRSIGIFMGGTDALQMSALALQACREVARFGGPIEIVTTSSNPHLAVLERLCAASGPTELRVDLPDLAGFFGRHDLQIGAGGGAAWERCCIGAPTLTLKWADNQFVVLDALEAHGAARTSPVLTAEAIGSAVAALVEDSEARRLLSERSRGWIDGRGAERVALAMHSDAISLRPATLEDAAAAHAWRNDARTRRFFRNPAPVALDEHLAWWARTLRDDQRRLLIACCGPRAVGSIRFDFAGEQAEVSLYIDPELTGLGLGRRLLEAAKRWVTMQSARVRRVVAEVLPENTASARAFRAAGFGPTDPSHWSWEATR